MKARWNGKIIADSADTVVVEGNHYFPLSSIEDGYFQLNEDTSYCPWKGTASYYDISIDGAVNKSAAWIYQAPKEAAKDINERVAFWHGVEVTED